MGRGSCFEAQGHWLRCHIWRDDNKKILKQASYFVAATNDYFNQSLICWSLSRLIDESLKVYDIEKVMKKADNFIGVQRDVVFKLICWQTVENPKNLHLRS